MGGVHPEVMKGHLSAYPKEESHLRPFLQNFDLTWARRQMAYGSNLSVYFLKPEPHMERAFGFESEILAVYSSYETIQPRTIQAIERFISEQPARGRVDTMIAFLISESDDPITWVKQYMTSNPESRLVAAFTANTLRNSGGDSWMIRSILSDQLFQRDLFNYRLPINSDYFFFGREDLIFDFHNAFKRSENRGLFGLRKTGKTSVFFKLQRLIKSTSDDICIYVDCKFPPRRSSRWEELLKYLAEQLSEYSDYSVDIQDVHASDGFLAALGGISNQKRVAIIFDEIEYISPFSPLDDHWKQDFIPFWQTIWYAQGLHGNLAIFVGGVNPTVVEKDLIDNTQNPLFGIVPHVYLGGLSVDEVRRMLRTLGRPMGLRFTEDAVSYVFDQYGGHPLLTRIACSIIHVRLRDSEETLPKVVDKIWLQTTEEYREAELSFYCNHVVSELRLFYPDEYEIMTEMARGNLADVYEFISDPTYTTHLNSYGLLKSDSLGRPSISISVVDRFIRLQYARDNGNQTILAIQPSQEREGWLKSRKRQIDANIGELQQVITNLKRPRLFGPNNYPESHRFFDIGVVSNESDFSTFINTCNRCFVEPIERYGRSIENSTYFWDDIGRNYPALSEALRRIKIYRHNRVHIRLTGQAVHELDFFLKRDLSGRSPSNVSELWFQLQQCVLDDLLVGILVETDRLT